MVGQERHYPADPDDVVMEMAGGEGFRVQLWLLGRSVGCGQLGGVDLEAAESISRNIVPQMQGARTGLLHSVRAR